MQEQIEKEQIKVIKVHTSQNAADILTKSVARQKFEYCLELVGFDLPKNE